MMTEQQQEQASLYVLGELSPLEQQAFEAELRAQPKFQALVHSLQRTTTLIAMATPALSPPPALRDRIMRLVGAPAATPAAPSLTVETIPLGLSFIEANDSKGWKQLPVPGAFIKLLSFQRERGYAVLLGKLEPGVRYPAHLNAGPEDFCILTGDLHVAGRRLGPGDFHHADAGSHHGENYSVAGCTLVAVLTADDPLVAFAMA